MSTMDRAPADSQIPALMRQKMLNRASTFADGARPPSPNSSNAPHGLRRRSSLLSNFSDAQQSLRSSTDSLLRPRHNDMDTHAASDDSTWWHQSPVLVAIIPALAALTHPHGGTIATDLVMLLLSAWFLSRAAEAPWQWYNEARQRQYLEAAEPTYQDTIHEEEEESRTPSPERQDPATTRAEEAEGARTRNASTVENAQQGAREELRRTELMAFVACFVGPLLGAYLLHNVRSQFTHRTRDGIVTDLNLILYVLGAEMRPLSRLTRMVSERTLHLQQLVKAEPLDQSRPGTAQGLSQRMAELEARFDGPMPSNNVDVTRITAEVRQSMQHQLDALNRAVRKYEKRHMAQSIQIEARFQEIDVRLKDTLSLAAAAARTGQKPGFVSMTLSWMTSFFAYWLQAVWDITMYPLRVASSAVEAVKSVLFKDERMARRRTKGQLNGHSSIPTTPRVQSRSGR